MKRNSRLPHKDKKRILKQAKGGTLARPSVSESIRIVCKVLHRHIVLRERIQQSQVEDPAQSPSSQAGHRAFGAEATQFKAPLRQQQQQQQQQQQRQQQEQPQGKSRPSSGRAAFAARRAKSRARAAAAAAAAANGDGEETKRAEQPAPRKKSGITNRFAQPTIGGVRSKSINANGLTEVLLPSTPSALRSHTGTMAFKTNLATPLPPRCRAPMPTVTHITDSSASASRDDLLSSDDEAAEAVNAFVDYNTVFDIDNYVQKQYCVSMPIQARSFAFGLFRQKPKKTKVPVPTLDLIFRFVTSIFQIAHLNPECSIIALIYIERLMVKRAITLNSRNWLTITMMAFLLASKTWDDLGSWNIEFAEMFPVFTLRDVNDLERRFLNALSFDLFISGSLYAKYYFGLRAMRHTAAAPTSAGSAAVDIARRVARRRNRNQVPENATTSASSHQRQTPVLERHPVVNGDDDGKHTSSHATTTTASKPTSQDDSDSSSPSSSSSGAKKNAANGAADHDSAASSSNNDNNDTNSSSNNDIHKSNKNTSNNPQIAVPTRKKHPKYGSNRRRPKSGLEFALSL
eukprot:TRINITY_DN67805_c7_g1_i1.p1 TRINITY_DN67805_c7_g1~~TRINITY_DN67805_c7_g1_i1.p1  ORF type:complete len:573 (-),score=276.20 TRINITY_DN67805_c7_g1_i1:49-1767(-)